MVRLKCSKCNNVFETDTISAMLRGTGLLNLGPYRLLKCPACGKRSLFKFFTSINEPVTWPKPEETQEAQPMMSEEEFEKKRIEDSKYERNQN